MTTDLTVDEEADLLSVIEGGPGNGILRRLKLAQPLPAPAVLRISLLLAVVTWVPLAVLSAIEGFALHGVTIPFVDDLAAHARFLVSVPILVLAEIPVGTRLRGTVRHFLVADLIRPEDRGRLAQLVAETVRFRDSRKGEVILITIVVVASWYAIEQGLGPSVSTWYLPQRGGPLSIAGYWYAFVALPIFQFLMFRWFYRLVVWARFLAKLAKLDLLLTATHPDGAGGLAFLGRATTVFGVILFAVSAVVSAAAASRVLFAGASLYDFISPYATLIVLALVIFVGPLLLFMGKLFETKERGLYNYGTLATKYTQRFHQKWVAGGAPPDEPLLGTADIQSLADLGNSYVFVQKMTILPITPADVIMLALAAAIPALPLAATVMPVSDIVKDLFKLLA